VLDRDRHVHDVTIDPRDQNTLRSGFESSAWNQTTAVKTGRAYLALTSNGDIAIPDPATAKKFTSQPSAGRLAWLVDGENRLLDIVTPELQLDDSAGIAWRERDIRILWKVPPR